QLAAEAVPGRSTLAEAQFDQLALALEDLRRQLAAVFPAHRPLDALHDRRDGAAVILELLGAVLHDDSGPLADVLVVRALVGILKAPPTADVVGEDDPEVPLAALDQ